MSGSSQHASLEMRNHFCTNTASRFKTFNITLSNGANLSGLLYLPVSKPESSMPLVVGIHGATCSAHTFDLTATQTITKVASMLNLPFLAINRPNYLGSSGWLVNGHSSTTFPPTPGLTYFEEDGQWLHKYILPAIWKSFVQPNGFTSIVTLSHSMAVPTTIIAASHYSSHEPSDRTYVWSGMSIYGYAEILTQIVGQCIKETTKMPSGWDEKLHILPFSDEDRVALMAGPSAIHDPSIQAALIQQQTPFFQGEIANMMGEWAAQKERYKAGVKLPILYSLGEYDYICQGAQANVEAFLAGFVNAEKIEGGLVRGAPHAIELGKEVGDGWAIKNFGWAIEVDAGLRIAQLGITNYV